MLWGLLAPALLLGLWMGWVQNITIPRLETKVETLTAERDRLSDAIENKQSGWRVRLAISDANVVELRGTVTMQNERLDAIAAEKIASDKRAEARVAEVRAQRDEYERRITAYQNIIPQADIPEQAISLIRGRFGR